MADQSFSRVALAAEQLDVAISLFLNEISFVSALTLAGAAEEIFGKAVSHSGRDNSLDWSYEAAATTLQWVHRRPISKQEFINGENHARNAAKHLDTANGASVTADLEDASLWMIVRACDNFDRLEMRRTPRMTEFESWFYEHVVGY